MSVVSKVFEISTGDYRRAQKEGAKAIIAKNLRDKVVFAEVKEYMPKHFCLHYDIQE